ncbi:hypothetical protein [Iningainema tapete]|uniref:Uncharacterized protein n=1 Tax=Iningainema tapete BLCC-T55 TaxID=2748662 RepID=A0A8J6XIF9_9CYAN|nr:hypothetical protein [Iningainema tapete]MBD2773352.1 hypothetical protein [Iningainema tapete BLCC-T55]
MSDRIGNSSVFVLLLVQADFQRQARQDSERIKEAELPQLWILASTVSDNLLLSVKMA